MGRLLLIFLLLLPFAAAEEFIFDDSLYSAKDVTTHISVDNRIDIIGKAEELTATLHYIPIADEHTTVTDERITPDARRDQESLVYQWRGVTGSAQFSYEATVRRSVQYPKVRERIAFPYDYVPPELHDYLQEEEIIQITPEISSLASQLVRGENDAYRAVFELGRWVKDNIEYDLNTVTAEASQTSQWVLDTRTGVCDELTSLFIAMVRSQGIPARFVSGVAYTNLESLDTNWGPHGWAEVWYPQIGWVPYDVTYGQYGFVDATHIPFQHSMDARSNAAEYYMTSYGAQMQPQELERTTTFIEKGDQTPPPVLYEAELALEEVGFGSANRIDVLVENPHPYYVSAELFLARTQNVHGEDHSKSLLLGPRETARISWTFEVEDDLSRRYVYTFPVVIYTNRNDSVRASFQARSGGPVASREELEILESVSSLPLEGDMRCDAPKTVGVEEEASISCTFDKPVRLCIDEECADASTRVTVQRNFERLGAYTLTATASKDGREQEQRITITVLDDPSLVLRIKGPSELGTQETGTLRVLLHKTSIAHPKDILIELEHPMFTQSWTLEQLTSNATLELVVPGNALISGENTITATASYLGTEGLEVVEQEFRIQAKPESLADRITLWINWLATRF